MIFSYVYYPPRKLVTYLKTPFTIPITSDITLDISKFRLEDVTESTMKVAPLIENINTSEFR